MGYLSVFIGGFLRPSLGVCHSHWRSLCTMKIYQIRYPRKFSKLHYVASWRCISKNRRV